MINEESELNSLELNVTKVLAAIVQKLGTVEVSVLDLVKSYDDKELGVTVLEESGNLIFELVDRNSDESR